MPEYVYVSLDDFEMGRSLDEQPHLEYVYSVGHNNWTSDPYEYRNRYDSEEAEYLRVERSYAENNLAGPVGGDETEEE